MNRDAPRRGRAGRGLAAAFGMTVREWRLLVPIALTVRVPTSLAANGIA